MFTGGVVKYQTLLRIWDVYFLEGFNVFYFVAIALLKTFQCKATLLEMKKVEWDVYGFPFIDQLLSRNFESCMTLLSSTLTVPDDDKFMKLVKKLHDRYSHRIPALRHEYAKIHKS